MTKTKLEIMPTMITFSAKCSDMFSASLQDANDNTVGEYQGYVPSFFPGTHYGDYVMFDVDLATGQIKNWKAPTLDNINDMLDR